MTNKHDLDVTLYTDLKVEAVCPPVRKVYLEPVSCYASLPASSDVSLTVFSGTGGSTVVDGDLGDSVFSYDGGGYLVGVSFDFFSRVVTYSGDLVASVVDSNGNYLDSFTYDSDGFLTSVLDSQGRSVALVYDADGVITSRDVTP